MVDHLRLSGAAEATITNYVRAVRDLMELTGKTPAQLTGTEVIAHLNRYRELKQLSSSSLNTRICGLVSFAGEEALCQTTGFVSKLT
jgi:hypothetical protein